MCPGSPPAARGRAAIAATACSAWSAVDRAALHAGVPRCTRGSSAESVAVARRSSARAAPPDTQRGQAAEPGTGKRTAIVAANPLRQSILAKGPVEPPTRRLGGAAETAIAAQDEAAEAVAQRQRIAIHAVTRAKLAFEIRRPHRIRSRGHGQRPPTTGQRPGRAAARRDQTRRRAISWGPSAGGDAARRAGRRPAPDRWRSAAAVGAATDRSTPRAPSA